MNFKRMKSLLATMAVVAVMVVMTLASCTTTADYTLGQELAPTNQQMTMRNRIYRGGVIKEANRDDVPCKVFESRLFRTDSIQSTSLDMIFLGQQNDPEFGRRTMGVATQFVHMALVDDSIGFGYRPIYDSMMLLLLVDTVVGDTMTPVKYNIYQLSAPLVEEGVEDTVFYTSYDPRAMGHLAPDAEPIFSFKFPDYANGVYTNSMELRLKEEAGAKAFINKLLCMETLDENGFANKIDVYESDSAFISNFRGIWIEPAEGQTEGTGSVFSSETGESGLQIYGRSRNPGADADIILDTINIPYIFYTKYASEGNVAAQSVKYDFTGSRLDGYPMDEDDTEREDLALTYVDGCAGVITELYLTDEFLLSLRNINSGDEDYVSAAINQAMLRFYIEDADYDYLVMDPIKMGEQMDRSIPRLGLYTDYKRLSPVVDYMYEEESNGSTIYFNGHLNRSLAAYEMNISSFMQGIVNEVLALEADANGNVDLSKLDVPRKLYLAPSAYNRYTLSRSKVQGGNSDLTKASIELSLTYTLVK